MSCQRVRSKYLHVRRVNCVEENGEGYAIVHVRLFICVRKITHTVVDGSEPNYIIQSLSVLAMTKRLNFEHYTQWITLLTAPT